MLILRSPATVNVDNLWLMRHYLTPMYRLIMGVGTSVLLPVIDQRLDVKGRGIFRFEGHPLAVLGTRKSTLQFDRFSKIIKNLLNLKSILL